MELKTYFAQDASGNIMPGATVTVYEAGTATLATGLQDESGSPMANPFTADSSAKVAFYAPDGLYDITVVGNGRTVTIRAQFVSVDGASVLRADLAATGGSALVGYGGGTVAEALDVMVTELEAAMPITTQGDLVVGGAGGTPARLPKGVDGKVLKMVSGAPAWGDESGGGGATVFATVQSYGGTPGGTVDATAAIQSALNSGLPVLIDDVFLTTGNEVPSGCYILFAGKGQLKLANGANRPVLQNANWNKSSWGASAYGIDKDITIEGLNIDGNQANQVHHLTTGPYAGEYVSGVRFFGVKNLVIKRTTINYARTFGLWLCAIDGLIFDGAYFNQYMGGTPDNQDGLHINGPARNLFIRNLYGYTNDDLLALNADDGALGANVTAGAITDVVVDGVAGIGALNGIRLLSATSRIDRVQISNVTGSYRDPAINLSAYGLGSGNFGAVSIDGVDAACSNAYNGAGSDYYGVVVLDDAIGTVSITNIKRSNAADNRPLIDVRPGAVIRQLLIDGVSLYTAAGGVSAETVVNVQGTMSVLCLRNLDWHRDASVARGGRVVYGNGGTVGQLNASGWSTRRLGSLVELSSGTIDPIRLTDVLDADSDPSGAVILLANGAATGVYTTDIRTDPGRRTVKATGGSTVWPGSMIGSASGAGAYLSANQSCGPAYSVGAFDTVVYDRAQEYSTSTRNFTNTIGQGLYDITVLAGITVPTANTTIVIALFKNGSAFRYMYGNAHSADCNITTTCRVPLADSDVIDVRFYSSNATTFQAGQDRTAISISRAT